MAYDEELAERIRELLAAERGVTEKKMFGGLAFMVNGHMCCGIVATDLVVRTGPDAFGRALKRPHARPMGFTGRPHEGLRLCCSRWISLGAQTQILDKARTRFRSKPTAEVSFFKANRDPFVIR